MRQLVLIYNLAVGQERSYVLYFIGINVHIEQKIRENFFIVNLFFILVDRSCADGIAVRKYPDISAVDVLKVNINAFGI